MIGRFKKVLLLILFPLFLLLLTPNVKADEIEIKDFKIVDKTDTTYIDTLLFKDDEVKNKDKVSSIFCDVIGDVCGVITGSTGAAIIVGIVSISDVNTLIVSLIIMGLLSTITITGKAIGKNIAMRNSTIIIRTVAKLISVFKKVN